MYRGRYPAGTKVQHRNGYIFIKTGDGLKPESRFIWEQHRGELKEGDKVFHLDGDRTNNNIRNLAKIHFNTTKFVFLKESKVLFMPKKALGEKRKFTDEILGRARARDAERMRAEATLRGRNKGSIRA